MTVAGEPLRSFPPESDTSCEQWGLTPLVERDHEARELERLLARARKQGGGLLLLEGSPGVGKSILVDLARRRATEAGIKVLSARGSELESQIPFGVVMQFFEPHLHGADSEGRARLFSGMARPAATLFGAAGDAEPPARERVPTLLYGLYWLLGNVAWPASHAGPVPVLIVVDDAQWADAPSLRFVLHLLMRVAELPLALVVATRPAAVGLNTGGATDSESARQLLVDIEAHAAVTVLTLRPLTEHGVHEVVRSAYGSADGRFVQACGRASGGNPFLLVELLRGLRAAGIAEPAADLVEDLVPDSVGHSISRRVGRLGREAAALASAAAILGDGAPLRWIAALAGLESEAADQAVEELAGEWILRKADPPEFVNPMTAAAVRAELTELARGQLHARAGALLLREGASVDAVCSHLVLARRMGEEWVVDTLRKAADDAQAHGNYVKAARLLARALEEPPAASLRDRVLLELANAQAASGDPQALGRLSDLLTRTEDPLRRARTLRSLSQLLLARANYALAADAAESGLAALGRDDPVGGELLGLYMTASSFEPGRRFTQQARWDAILSEARQGRLPAEPLLASHLAGAMAVRWMEAPARVRQIALAALEARAPAQDPHGYVISLAVAALIYVDELEAAQMALDSAAERVKQAGSVIAISQVSQSRTLLLYRRGRITEVVAEAEHALKICRSGWTAHLGWCAAILAHAHLERGDADSARKALRAAETVDTGSLQWALVLEARGAVARHEGDTASAFADLCAAGAHLEQRYQIVNPMFLNWQCEAAIAAGQLGDAEAAAHLAESAVAGARQSGRPRALGEALRAAGRVAGGPRGIELLAAAVATLEDAPAPLELAHALVDLGAALKAAGDDRSAREPLGRALEIATSCGALALAERSRRELLATGARPRRAARSGAAALTPMELRIAGLAARGAGNLTIADELFITTKTVEWHLTNAYRKLGIHSREELAAHLGDRPT